MGFSAFYTAGTAGAAERRNGPGDSTLPRTFSGGWGWGGCSDHMVPANNRLSWGVGVGVGVRDKGGRESPVARGKRRMLHG